jgi:zinc/manganese transport system substrate-binding protein
MKIYRWITTLGLGAMLLLALSEPARAALNVFACEPEWAALTQELGGDLVSVYSATTGQQDPHHIQARPSLIARVRNADLLVCTGAELEVGWLPVLLLQSANGHVQPGAPGNLEAASYVSMMEVPSTVDRAEGDVHAAGNPHIQTDPRNIAAVAKPLAERLAQLDPAHAPTYRQRYADFAKRWSEAIARWQSEAAPLKGVPVVVHHKNWAYLFRWLGIREVGTLEPKPGVPPSTAHLNELIAQLKAQPARMVIRAAYEEERASQFISEREHLPQVALPFTIGGTPQATDLFSLFNDTINRLLTGLHA